jgi:hypothetical protein
MRGKRVNITGCGVARKGQNLAEGIAFYLFKDCRWK